MGTFLESVLGQRLTKVLGATITEEPRGRMAREMGFTDPAPGRHADDLAFTRFPAGVPQDRLAEMEKHFGIPTDEAPYCIKIGPDDKMKPLAKVSDIEIGKPWTKTEIVNALWEIISRTVRAYTTGGWNRTNGAIDREAFGELVQMAVVGVLGAIDSEEDRGDAYLPWIKMSMKGPVSAGMVVDGPTNAACGFYGNLIAMTRPEQVGQLINHPKDGIQLIDRTKPRKPREGNRYGEHAPTLYKAAQQLAQVLVACKSKDPDIKATATDDLAELRKFLKSEKEALKSHGRLLGARTGLYDTISTPHSDGVASAFLTKVLEAQTYEQLKALGPVPSKCKNKEVAAMHATYLAVMKAGDNNKIEEVAQIIKQWIADQGDRRAFKKAHRREGISVPGASGDMMDNPSLPGTPDTFKQKVEQQELHDTHQNVVKQLIIAGMKGVPVTDVSGHQRMIKLVDREFRLLIRAFGIKDYPYRNTGKDPEIDQEKFEQLANALAATVGKGANEAVPIQPFNAAEKRWLAELSARTIATDYDDFEQNYKDLIDYCATSDRVLVVAPDEDAAIEIARRAASSDWVRRGCPQLTTGELFKDIWGGKGDKSTPGLAMLKLIGRPKSGQKYINIGGADPESKLYQIAHALKDELGIDKLLLKHEDIKSAIDLIIENALWSFWKISKHFTNRAVLTESVDAIDLQLLRDVQDVAGRYLADFYITNCRHETR